MVSNSIMHSSTPTACGSTCNSNWLATASCTPPSKSIMHSSQQQHVQRLQQQTVSNIIMHSSPATACDSACNSNWLSEASCTPPQQQHMQRLQQEMVSNNLMHCSSNGMCTCSTSAPGNTQLLRNNITHYSKNSTSTLATAAGWQ
jgi:hypothetical protein